MVYSSLSIRVGWYTSLLGKKTSLKFLLKVLRRLNIPHHRSKRLEQGRTMRWVIAWSFQRMASTRLRYTKLGVVKEIEIPSIPEVNFHIPVLNISRTMLPNESFDVKLPLVLSFAALLRQRLELSLREQGYYDINKGVTVNYSNFNASSISDTQIFCDTLWIFVTLFGLTGDAYAVRITANVRDDSVSFISLACILNSNEVDLALNQRFNMSMTLERLRMDIERNNRKYFSFVDFMSSLPDFRRWRRRLPKVF